MNSLAFVVTFTKSSFNLRRKISLGTKVKRVVDDCPGTYTVRRNATCVANMVRECTKTASIGGAFGCSLEVTSPPRDARDFSGR
jgi:hypothetical protein